LDQLAHLFRRQPPENLGQPTHMWRDRHYLSHNHRLSRHSIIQCASKLEQRLLGHLYGQIYYKSPKAASTES